MFFADLGSAVTTPDGDSPNKRTITKFNEMMIIAYREFQIITSDMIKELRTSHQLKVAHGLDTYAKRGVIRNLNDTSKFSKDQLLIICDIFFGILFYEKKNGKKGDTMDLASFRMYLAKIAPWANVDRELEDQAARVGSENMKPIVGAHFLEKLFSHVFGAEKQIGLQNVVTGLGKLMFSDLSKTVELFFDIHDAGNKQSLTKEELIAFSETMLFLFRVEEGDTYLNAVSNFLRHIFALEGSGLIDKKVFTDAVLNDPVLSEYFAHSFPKSFSLKHTGDQVERTRVMPAKDLAENLLSGIKFNKAKRPPVPILRPLTSEANVINAAGDSKDAKQEAAGRSSRDEETDLLDEVDDLLREAEQTTL
jgi:hypothetical protein